ncbi:MAG: Cys-tRNA(Pro) deacylase [Oscillospiraceae bacterium]|nr:Cys-tRNA(Pro) deacylase [Oscillospiraceae bacterium]
MAEQKTNVMRILDKAKITYQAHFYNHQDGAIDGVSVAKKLGQPLQQVFKTLVTKGADKNYYVFVIPVEKELDLKAAARAAGTKSIEMIPVAEINKVTGYIRGGCSPIGMKKQFGTIIDIAAQTQTAICVSGGKIGTQVELAPEALMNLINGKMACVTVQ